MFDHKLSIVYINSGGLGGLDPLSLISFSSQPSSTSLLNVIQNDLIKQMLSFFFSFALFALFTLLHFDGVMAPRAKIKTVKQQQPESGISILIY